MDCVLCVLCWPHEATHTPGPSARGSSTPHHCGDWEEPASVLSPSPWAPTATLTQRIRMSKLVFGLVYTSSWAVGNSWWNHWFLGKPGVTKVRISHLIAHFSKDCSQNSSLPSWSRRSLHICRGLGACPCLWVYRHVSDAQGYTQGALVEAQKPFPPSFVPCQSHCWLCCLCPALCQPPKDFCIFLRATARVISTTLMWSLFFLHLGPTLRNPALCSAAGIEWHLTGCFPIPFSAKIFLQENHLQDVHLPHLHRAVFWQGVCESEDSTNVSTQPLLELKWFRHQRVPEPTLAKVPVLNIDNFHSHFCPSTRHNSRWCGRSWSLDFCFTSS